MIFSLCAHIKILEKVEIDLYTAVSGDQNYVFGLARLESESKCWSVAPTTIVPYGC